MQLDLDRVQEYVRRADTEELLDRVTVYREGMEPAALDLMEAELLRRGITPDHILQFAELRCARAIMLPDGTAMRCSFCDRPAVVRSWNWHRLWGRLPVFPMRFAFCEKHESRSESRTRVGSEAGRADPPV